ncbi:MAG TPA: hypothetical protein VNT75_16720, partial [Symbiobacteriaceae bacterium]|nr:hypothetical protein [Symbiobacteriaceae bacterium]
MRRSLSWLVLTLLVSLAVLALIPVPAMAAGPTVYVIHIDKQQMIDMSVAQTVERGFQQAAADPSAAAVA